VTVIVLVVSSSSHIVVNVDGVEKVCLLLEKVMLLGEKFVRNYNCYKSDCMKSKKVLSDDS
jgi:hypothetical protein